jgi:hypothetical protein
VESLRAGAGRYAGSLSPPEVAAPPAVRPAPADLIVLIEFIRQRLSDSTESMLYQNKTGPVKQIRDHGTLPSGQLSSSASQYK